MDDNRFDIKGETFAPNQVASAIRSFLQYGEDSFGRDGGHKGYFSNCGWAARCLRWHLRQVEGTPDPSRGTPNQTCETCRFSGGVGCVRYPSQGGDGVVIEAPWATWCGEYQTKAPSKA